MAQQERISPHGGSEVCLPSLNQRRESRAHGRKRHTTSLIPFCADDEGRLDSALLEAGKMQSCLSRTSRSLHSLPQSLREDIKAAAPIHRAARALQTPRLTLLNSLTGPGARSSPEYAVGPLSMFAAFGPGKTCICASFRGQGKSRSISTSALKLSTSR